MPEGNRQIELQHVTEAPPDALGRPQAPTWTTYATPWARVTQPGGQEFFTNANPVQGRQPAVFRFRYVAGIKVTHRVRWNELTYDIHGVVDEGGDHRWVELHTSAAVPQEPVA